MNASRFPTVDPFKAIEAAAESNARAGLRQQPFAAAWERSGNRMERPAQHTIELRLNAPTPAPGRGRK